MADVVSSPLETWQGRSSLRGGATPAMLWLNIVLAPVAMARVRVDTTEVSQMYGIHAYPLRACDALGLDHVWYEAPTAHKTSNEHVPLEHGLKPRNPTAFTLPRSRRHCHPRPRQHSHSGHPL
jgi:hypothetical protein